jgi:hypothetical protein
MREGWWRARTHYASKPSATIGPEVKRAVLASLARSTAARARFIRPLSSNAGSKRAYPSQRERERATPRLRNPDRAARQSVTSRRSAKLIGVRVRDRGEAIRPSGDRTVRAAEVAVGELVRAEVADEGQTVTRDDGVYAAAGNAEAQGFAEGVQAPAQLGGAVVRVAAGDHLREQIIEDDRRVR